jgi:hypothetical protein
MRKPRVMGSDSVYAHTSKEKEICADVQRKVVVLCDSARDRRYQRKFRVFH